jgi:hypothetical protein
MKIGKKNIKHIEKLIPQRHIVVFSPHYDDVLFFIGGYILGLKEQGLLSQKSFHVKIGFSRSNYQVGDGKANLDSSLDRVKYATGKRLLEDQNCLDELIGAHNYTYELLGEEEAFVRGVQYASSEMEFPYGNYDTFKSNDWAILERMKYRIKQAALQANTALIFPLSFKDHIDHFITREAAIQVAQELGKKAKATFYFQEDKPYGGIATQAELDKVEHFITQNNMTHCLYAYDPEAVIDIAFRHYTSQVEEVYATGIRQRAKWWQEQLGTTTYWDRMVKFK